MRRWRSLNRRWAGVMQFGNVGGLLLNIDTASWLKESCRSPSPLILQKVSLHHANPAKALCALLQGICLRWHGYDVFLPNAMRCTKAEQMIKYFLAFFISFPVFFCALYFHSFKTPLFTPANLTYTAQADVSNGVCAHSSEYPFLSNHPLNTCILIYSA